MGDDDASRRGRQHAVPHEVAWYVRTRLERECPGYGAQTEFSRASNACTPEYISQLIANKRRVGFSVAARLARHWGLSFTAGLFEEARRAWAEEQRRVGEREEAARVVAETRPFGERPEWGEARAEVERKWPYIPARYLDAVGRAQISGVKLSARFIRGQALLLEEVAEAEAAGEERDETAAERRALKAGAAPGPRTGAHPRVVKDEEPRKKPHPWRRRY